MLKGGHKVFENDYPALVYMLNLRAVGLSVESLGIVFSCHHSTPQFQCSRYGIVPQGPTYSIQRVSSAILHTLVPADEWVVEDGELVRPTKSYAEYLKESQERDRIRKTK